MTECVSIIMPCYNCEKTIEKTLKSIYDQIYTDFHLHCVNDGSTDQTHEILESYAKTKPNITVYHKHNAGQTLAKNDALKMAKGEFVAFIDSDDLWHPKKLLHQVQLMKDRPKVGLSYTNGFYINETDQQQELIGFSEKLQGQCLEHLILGNAIVASSVLVRASCLTQVGIFDERLTACENWELWIRIASVAELAVIDQPFVYYRRHSNNMSHNLDKMRKNRLQVIAKNAGNYQSLLKNHKKIIRSAYYTAYQFFGENYLWKGQVGPARLDLMRALRYKPFNNRIYLMLLKTLLGKTLLAKIRKMRSREIEPTMV